MDNPGNNIDKGGGMAPSDVSSNNGTGSSEGHAVTAEGNKPRSPLDKLTKEELLTKCKNLIVIAQKAKYAKDEALTELKNCQDKASVELEAMMEMINNLTEGKVALITKTESLQRQLNLTSSELETLQSSQDQLLQSQQEAQKKVEAYEAKIHRIKERSEKHMIAEREKQEKLMETQQELLGKVENLEAQTSQVEVLKVKCKKLVDQNSKLEDFSKQAKAAIAEKKANDIILQETKNQKKQLEENANKLMKDIKEFQAKNVQLETAIKKQDLEIGELKLKVTALTENQEAKVEERDDGESLKLALEMKSEIEDYEKKCSNLESLVTQLREKSETTDITEEITESVIYTPCSHETLLTEVEELRSRAVELEATVEANKQLSFKMESLRSDCQNKDELVTELQKTVEKQEEERNNLDQLFFDANEKCSMLESEIQTLKKQLNVKEKDLILYSEKKTCYETEIETLKNDLKFQEERYAELQGKISESSSDLRNYQTSIHCLNSEIEILKGKLEANERLSEKSVSQTDNLQKTIQDLNSQLENSKQKIELLSNAAEFEVKQSSEKDNRLRDLEQKLNEATMQISEKSELVGKLEVSNEFLEKKVQELQLEIDGHIEEIKVIKDKINYSLKLEGDEFPGLKIVLGSIPDAVAEVNALDGVLVSRLDAMLLGLEEYIQSSKIRLEDFSTENGKINAELNTVNKEKALLQKQLGELDEKFKESVAALNKELEVLRQSCDNSDSERSFLLEKEAVATKLSKQKDLLENECSELKERVVETSEQNDRLNLRISELQEVEKKLRGELEVKENDLKDFMIQAREAKLLTDTLVSKENILSGLSETLDKERTSFLAKLEDEQRVQADLKRSVETLVEEAARDQKMVQEFKTIIQDLEQGNDEKVKILEDVNRDLQNECEKWTRENETIKLANLNLNEQCSLKTSDCDDLASKILDLEKQIGELKSKEDDSAIATVEQQSKLNELRDKLKETVETCEKKISIAMKEAETVQEEMVSIKEENERFGKHVIGLEEKLQRVTSERKGLEEEITRLENVLTETRTKLTKVLQEKDECACELSKIREEVSARTADAAKLKEKNEKLVSDIRQSGLEDDMQVADLKKDKDDLHIKLKALERVIQETQDSLDLTVKEKDELLTDVKLTRENCDKLIKEKELLGSDLEDVTKARDALNSKLNLAITERDSFSKQLESLTKEKEGSLGELSALTGERDAVKSELQLVTSELQELKSVLKQVQKAREELSITSESCLKELTNKSEECQQLQEELNELANKCRGLEEEAEQLREAQEKAVQLEEQLKACGERAKTAEEAVRASDEQRDELNAQHRAATARCQELLQELNEVTGVLRERGERISRLEVTLKDRHVDMEHLTADLKTATSKVTKLEQEKQAYESQLVSVQLQLSDEQSQVEAATEASRRENELQEKIIELEKALEVVKKEKELLHWNGAGEGDKTTCGGSSGDKIAAAVASDGPAGDALSTSTMSKAEDVHRLKDLEDTFEERYMKLKSVAIKLKKKLAEQTLQLNATEELKNKLLAEKEQLGPVKNASKNIQILQAEVDRLQDSVESGTKSVKERDAQLAAAATQLAEARNKLASQTEELSMLQATVESLEETTAQQQSKESDLQAKVLVLQQQASGHEEQENKQRSLLALELQDSERTIAELRCQLAEQEAAAALGEELADALRLRVASMDTQLEHLTAQRAADDTTSQHLRKSVEELRSQLTETEKEAITLRAVKQQQGAEIETLRQEVENQKVTVTEVSQAKSVTEEQSRRTAAMINKKVAALEERLESVTTELQQTTDELQYVKKEFEGYKARAQSVLKQQQQLQQKGAGVDVGELQLRLQLSETQLQALQHSNRHLQSELSALQSEHRFIQSEKERLSKQQKLDSTKASDQLAALREERDKLEEKLQRATTDSQTVIAKMAAEGEAMAASYEGQLKSRAAAHEREVCDLQCHLDAISRKLHDSGPPPATSVGGGVEGGVGVGGGKHHRRMDSADDLRGVDVTSMIREAGEGSEWVEPEQSHNKHMAVHGSRMPSMTDPSGDPYQPPPLHQLLLSGTGSADDSVSVSGSAAEQATSGSFLHSQLTALQAKIEAYEVRVQQVSALLHESEGENSKLSQLTDALKEEIRRGSRNTDREKHLENLEYLKNVVLQFLTLEEAGTDGRERLLPVLTTLLQLAPHEVKKVEALVKGGRDSSSANQGWGSYLHMWSGR